VSLTEEVLARLRSPDCPPRAVVRVLPGAGVRTVLAQFALEVSARDLVLVLAPSLLLVEQWAARLSEGGARVRVLRSAADALELRSQAGTGSTRGIVLCTFARAGHGQALAALGENRFQLVVYDGVAGSVPEALAAATDSALRSVAVVSGTTPFAWEGSVTLLEVTERSFAEAVREITLTNHQFEETPTDSVALPEAQTLLARYLPGFEGDRTAPATPASLHEMLLKIATSTVAAGEPSAEDKEAAWHLIDTLESISSPDQRLLALDQALRRDVGADKWVVVVPAQADAVYVADHLASQGLTVRLLTSATPLEDREAMVSWDYPAIVATSAGLSSLRQWPRGYGAVWWTPPRSRAEYEERMTLLATGGRVEVVTLLSRGAD
jgi:superfamily II DNA or RNA helicase